MIEGALCRDRINIVEDGLAEALPTPNEVTKLKKSRAAGHDKTPVEFLTAELNIRWPHMRHFRETEQSVIITEGLSF